MDSESLYFSVAPHIVQDLGINLYTTLPRVLVEFVANAHDADSPGVDVQMDFEAIREARQKLRLDRDSESVRLEDKELPGDLVLKITDHGHGMSRKQVQERFLIAGRRRREEDDSVRSPGGRILMGRKGLGKLAGFGIAKTVTITSRRDGDDYATRIVLDYDELIAAPPTGRIPIPTETLRTGLPLKGTEVVLSRLVFEPVKSRRQTVESELGNHFRFVTADDFTITVNGRRVQPVNPEHAYLWPDPGHADGELRGAKVTVGDREKEIRYRVRFTKKSLPAQQRGVRIYASGRLAAAPDLLELPTGMHGFRLTDYIDAIATADFIDQEPTEYIATDRRSLRWDTYFLKGLRDFLTAEMKAAVVAYQKYRDNKAEEEVEEDLVTGEIIAKARLSSLRQKTAIKMAAELAKTYPEGVRDPDYLKSLKILAEGLGQGIVLEKLAKLAGGGIPGLGALSKAVIELAARETGELARFAEGRIDSIEALKKIVMDVDFQASKKEKDLQRLLERAPWLIDPIFTQLVTADQWLSTTYKRLAKHLGIREFAEDVDKSRADLVFLVSTAGGSEITIVELKAADEALDIDHLQQLERYVRKAESFLEQHGKAHVRVRGLLIGSRNVDSRSEKVKDLDARIRKDEHSSSWRVRDIAVVLELAEAAQKDLIGIYRKVEADSQEPADPPGDTASQ